MVRTVVSIVLFVLLIVGCFWIYRIVTHDQVSGSGEVLVRSSPEHDQMESGTTYLGDKPIEAHPTPSRSDAPGTINTEPVAENGHSPANSVETTQYGADATTSATVQPEPKPFNNKPFSPAYPSQPGYQPVRNDSYGGGFNDSLPPNAPNGAAFAGTGAYQWYRQGDLTWRVDTKSGASCVDYATIEEWSKPLVYSHGCGRGGSWHHHRSRG